MSDLPPLPQSGPEAPLLVPPESDPSETPDALAVKAAQPAVRRRPSLSSIPPSWWAIGSMLIAVAALVAGIASSGPPPQQEAGAASRTTTVQNASPPQTPPPTPTPSAGPAEPLFRGDQASIRFGTPTFVRLGGAETSVWRVVVEEPRKMGPSRAEGNFRIDVTVSLESSTASGVVGMPRLVGDYSDRWSVSWGGLTRPPDQDQCSAEPDFVALPEEVRLRVGEQLTGSLCLKGPWSLVPLGTPDSRWNDNGLVELQTALGRIVFENEGRDEARIDIDGTVAQITGQGYHFDSPVQGVIDGPDVWNVVIGAPRDSEGRPIGDPSLASSDEILLSFPLVATLIDTPSDGHGRFRMLSYVIGGHSGTRYTVRVGDERCPNDREIEVGWAQVGYRMNKVACIEVSGLDAASPATVFAVSKGIGDLVLFRMTDEPPTPARIANAVTPPGRDFGDRFLVGSRWETPATEWTIVSVGDAASDESAWRNVTIQTAVEPSNAVAEFDISPFTVHVLGGATRLVHSTQCATIDVRQRDTFCVRVSNVDVNHPETRYVLQARYDFFVFDPTGP